MFRLALGLTLSSYRREWLARDVVAGIVLSTLLVPQAWRTWSGRTIDPGHFFPTIESAVAAFRRETGAEWAASQAPADRTGQGRQGRR